MPLSLDWASRHWLKLNDIRDLRMGTVSPGSFGLFGGGKSRLFQGEPEAAAIPPSEFTTYLAARGYAGEFLAEMLDDCLTIEAVYLRLHRLRARENVKRAN